VSVSYIAALGGELPKVMDIVLSRQLLRFASLIVCSSIKSLLGSSLSSGLLFAAFARPHLANYDVPVPCGDVDIVAFQLLGNFYVTRR